MQENTESLKIGAVVPTQGKQEDTIACLISLSKVYDSFHEIIVVDAGEKPLIHNRDFRKIFFSGLFPTERMVYVHTRSSLPYQRNKGASLSYSDILCFFDDGACPTADYTKYVQATFAEHPEYVAGFGHFEGEAALWHQTRTDIFSQAGRFSEAGIPLHPGEKVFKFQRTNVLNGCLVARRCVFVRHKFDEKMSGQAFMGECDFAKRVSSESYKMFFQPLLRITHASQRSENKHASYDESVMFMRNYSYVFFKNFYPEKKSRIFSYFWSIVGFSSQAFMQGKLFAVLGYFQGLLEYVVLRTPR